MINFPKKRIIDPKIKIEFSDSAGAKYFFAVEGGLSKENMSKLLDFVQTISPSSLQKTNSFTKLPTEEDPVGTDTNFARVYLLLETKFRFGSFTSGDVREACHDELGLPLSLPTVSTYLSRLADRALLTRSRNGAGWAYRLARPEQDIEGEPEQKTMMPPADVGST